MTLFFMGVVDENFWGLAMTFAAGGCVSIPAYIPPPAASAQVAVLETVRGADLTGVGYAIFADSDCQKGGGLDWMTWATAQSRTATIPAGVPVFVHGVHFEPDRNGDYVCASMTSFIPSQNGKYKAEIVWRGSLWNESVCQIPIYNFETKAPIESDLVSIGPGCKDASKGTVPDGRYHRFRGY